MTTRRALLSTVAIVPLVAASSAAQEATPESSEVTAEFSIINNVVYGNVDGHDLLLDVLHPPARPEPRPAVVTIHGGGWTEGYGDRSMMVGHARELAKVGYVVFNIAYRLLPDYTWPTQLDDVQRAVRWIRAHAATYGVDPERIGSFGYSSGGQLAAFLGVRETRDNSESDLADFSSRVQCVTDVAGDMDLTIPYPQPVDQDIAVQLLGGTAIEVPDAYHDASPINWVDEASAPFLIVHGGDDNVNPVEHSRSMEAALHDASVAITYFEDPDANHFTWGDWSRLGHWVLAFYSVQLEPER